MDLGWDWGFVFAITLPGQGCDINCRGYSLRLDALPHLRVRGILERSRILEASTEGSFIWMFAPVFNVRLNFISMGILQKRFRFIRVCSKMIRSIQMRRIFWGLRLFSKG